MLNYLKKIFSDNNPLILGFGREGYSTYNLIRKLLPDVKINIADKNADAINSIYKFDNNINFITGVNYLDLIESYYPIFRSPGISLININENIANKLTSQTKIFLNFFSSQIIGITGTKGKSTCSSLISHIYQLYNSNTLLAGNIGIPLFDLTEVVNRQTEIVCELSSHQLQDIEQAPHISILLNIYKEHLDHYKSYEEYQNSKFNILSKQTANDYCIYNADDEIISSLILESVVKSNIFKFSVFNEVERGCFLKENKIIFRNNNTDEIVYIDKEGSRQLRGSHNLLNIMAAIIAAKIKYIENKYIIKGISSMKPLSHRLEYVGKFNGIHFYNDSISTIPEATIAAVKSVKNVDCIILGGFDRGIDYKELAKFLYLSEINILIFIDAAGKRIMDELDKINKNKNKKIYYVDKFEDAVSIAKKETTAGKTCLLSPAAASYGMFKNFEERGEKFKYLILNT